MTKVYINGKLYDKAEAKISVYDHGLLYGDGVFEGIRIYHGKIFKLKEHVDRLYESARAIRLDIPLSKLQMMEAIQSTVDANNKKEGLHPPRRHARRLHPRHRPPTAAPTRRSSSSSMTSAFTPRRCTKRG